MLKPLKVLAAVCVVAGAVSLSSAEPAPSAIYYRRVLSAKPEHFDPILTGSGSEIQVLRQLFDQLVTYDKDFRWKPMLASAWTVSEDGRVYSFRIREGVKFSDGGTLTAEDAAYSIRRAVKDPSSKYFRDFYIVKGARAYREGAAKDLAGLSVVQGKLVIESEKANPYLLSILASPGGSIVSRGYGKGIKEKIPAGTGPFVVKRIKDKEVILEANKDYFLGAPKLAGIIYYIYDKKEDMFRDFTAKKLDDIAPNNLPSGADRAGLKRVFANGVITFFIVLNPAAPPLNNVYVRQALAMAVDFDAILAKLRTDYPMLARSKSYIPRGRLGYDASFPGLVYDPERALQLIRRAGYKSFSEVPQVTLQFTGNVPYSKEIAAGMRDYYSRVGLRFAAKTIPAAEAGENVASGNWHMDIIGWDTLYPDTYFLLKPFHSGSKEDWLQRKEMKLDELLDKCEMEMNPESRTALFRSINALVVDDAHVIPLYSGDMFDGSFQPWVKGINYPNTAFFELSMYPVSIDPELARQRPARESDFGN
jgi:peptide/nickel transport system substrate-binding protein